MNPGTKNRLGKLRIVWLGFVLIVLGAATIAPVLVIRKVVDDHGDPVFRADGSRMTETDHWGNFKINWVGNSLSYAGASIIIYALGAWCVAGFSRNGSAKEE